MAPPPATGVTSRDSIVSHRPRRPLLNALANSWDQVWPPFVLVAGLLLIGRVAAADGLFESVGARLARLPGNGVVVFAAMMLMVSVVTAILNLDTSVVFLTPVLIHTARQRGVPEDAFVYGSIFMANGASLVLPGSNLTNLLVLTTSHLRSSTFAREMVLPWIASIVVITIMISVWRWSDLVSPPTGGLSRPAGHWGVGLLGIVVATGLVLTLAHPALLILATGLACVSVDVWWLRRLTIAEARKSVNAATLLALMAVAMTLGVLAREWSGPAHLMASAGPWSTAVLGAGLANVVNNLPAAVLLSSTSLHHPLALLIGLDLGPNLLVTGALSSLLWLRIARAEGAHPSPLRFSLLGSAITVVSMVAALLTLQFVAPGAF